MKHLTRISAWFSCLVLVAAAGLPAARADQFDRKTTLTFSEPIQVPNRILEPGTYVFKLVDWKKSNKHIVQILSQDEKQVLTTIIAIPNFQLTTKEKTELLFWEVPAGQPRALRAWFYPGDNFGQEFAYPENLSAQISTVNGNVQVPVETSAVASTAVEPPPHVSEPTPRPAPEPAPAAAVVAPEPAQTAAVAPVQPIEPSPTITHSTPAELPHTASYEPLIFVAGLILLVAFAMTRTSRRTL